MNISVIIPTLNEQSCIDQTIRSLLPESAFTEIIIADGGSDDATVAQALRYPRVRAVHSEPGRASQMNAAARTAQGDVVLFLHADTQLPDDAPKLINQALRIEQAIAGCFSLRFDANHPMLKLYGAMSRINHRFCTFGDQGLFFRREVFEQLGGFKPQPIMEDLEIQTRVRRIGRFIKIKQPVTTSARRFQRVGIVRQQLLNIGLVTLYECGVSPLRLQRFYRSEA